MDRRWTEGEAFRFGLDSNGPDEVPWVHLWYMNRTECLDCKHARIHHLGFREPGCTFAGTCTCPKYKPPLAKPKRTR